VRAGLRQAGDDRAITSHRAPSRDLDALETLEYAVRDGLLIRIRIRKKIRLAMTELSAEPKTAKGKRMKARQGPVLFEDDKLTMFLRGRNCSGEVSKLMSDLANLKKPLVIPRKRDHNIYPFQDSSHIEKMANTAHTGLIVLGESSKKRKAAIVMLRMFNEQLLDAIELVVSNYVPASNFKGVEPCSVGAKPLIVFQGAGFSTAESQMSRLKNMFTDVLKGVNPKGVSLEGVEHTVVVTETESGKMLFRVYRIEKKRGENATIPRVELQEMGPSFDFSIGRERLPDFTLWKAAMRKPTILSTTSSSDPSKPKQKKNKNISTNALGQTVGRIHLGRQDYSKLNTPHRTSQIPKRKATLDSGEQSKKSRV
jgi:ribosome production factor 2